MVVSFLPDFLKEVVTPDLIGGPVTLGLTEGLLFAWRCPVKPGMTRKPGMTSEPGMTLPSPPTAQASPPAPTGGRLL